MGEWWVGESECEKEWRAHCSLWPFLALRPFDTDNNDNDDDELQRPLTRAFTHSLTTEELPASPLGAAHLGKH